MPKRARTSSMSAIPVATRDDIITDDQPTDAGRKSKGRNGDLYPAMPNIFRMPKMFGFPPNLITRMHYVTNSSLTSTAAFSGNVYSMNGLYDVDITGVGHQPMWYDTFATIYNHYCVLGSKITVTFTNGTTGIPAFVVLSLDDDTTFPSSWEVMAELNKSVFGTVGRADGGANQCTLTGTYGAQTDEGINPYAGGDLVRTAFGNNPTEGYYARIGMVPADGDTDNTVYYTVEIEFTVLLSELKTQTQS